MKAFFKISCLLLIGLTLASCKSQLGQSGAPFSIGERTYFHWVEGKEGGKGTTIILKGSSSTTNLSVSKIFFQNHEYDVVPEWRGLNFTLVGNRIYAYAKEKVISADPAQEYGNPVPPVGQKIPFDIEDDEAVIKYTVNGAESFLKVTGIKQLETVYKP